MPNRTISQDSTRREEIKPGDKVDAEIIQVIGDTCFLQILLGNDQKITGRLKQLDSLAWESPLLFEKLPDYQAGQRIKVMLTHDRTEHGRKVWFSHERWAHDNPWSDIQNGLSIQEGDRVTGWVQQVVKRKNFVKESIDGSLAGYLVQLDVTVPLRDPEGNIWQIEDAYGERADAMQPDLRVFLPAGELPEHGSSHRLVLQSGERVAALVLDARRTLPDHPLVSVQRLRDAEMAQFWSAMPDRIVPAVAPPLTSALRRVLLKGVDLGASATNLPWTGRKILLLDDQALAAHALEKTLHSRGADVTVWLPQDVDKGWRQPELAKALRETLLAEADLLLVDDGLPQAHRGEDALMQALEQLSRDGLSVRPRGVYLMSGSTPQPLRSPDTLQALGIHGALRRPIAVEAVQALLDAPATPFWTWQGEAVLDSPAPVAQGVSRTLNQLLRRVCKGAQQDYAVLLAVAPGGGLWWLTSAGKAPFEPEHLSELYTETGLGLLVRGMQTELVVQRGSTTNLIHPSHEHVGHWCALGYAPGRPEYLLGVGSRQGISCASIWPWLVHAAQAELQMQQLNTLFRNNTGALLAGWMTEGFAHETVHDRQDMLHTLSAMDTLCAKAEAQGVGVNPEVLRGLVNHAKRSTNGLEAKAQRLLKRHRQRAEPVHLPTWRESQSMRVCCL